MTEKEITTLRKRVCLAYSISSRNKKFNEEKFCIAYKITQEMLYAFLAVSGIEIQSKLVALKNEEKLPQNREVVIDDITDTFASSCNDFVALELGEKVKKEETELTAKFEYTKYVLLQKIITLKDSERSLELLERTMRRFAI